VRYGGYYTQDEIRQVVRYAAQRHVTVVPEIEMPGHALAALAANPQLSCTGGPFQTARTWGVFPDVYCTREETFTFMNDVLKEVCSLFPGPYVHIGGDECPKERWKACANCQAVIKREKLKDEHELQSWFVRRIGKILEANGKKMIGWDEILEGGLAPDATVMSWRGYQGGIDAARQAHDVIMTPTSYCYFDYYQSRNPGEPLAIGGYLPIEKVYSFEPVPAELSKDEAKHILGAQGNLWTEYILNLSMAEVAVLPRMCALAEVVWSPRQQRDYDRFMTRLYSHLKMLQFQGLSYSKAVYDVVMTVKPDNGKGLSIALSTPYKNGLIRYSLSEELPNGNSPVYTEPFKIDQSLAIRTKVFDGTMEKGNLLSQIFRVNYATGKDVILVNRPDDEYCTGGGFTRVNGLTGALPWNGSDWLGFRGKSLDATVDLGSVMGFSKVALDALNDEGSWIHFPKSVEVQLSDDGKNFTSVAKLSGEKLDLSKRQIRVPVGKAKARYVKIIAENAGVIPECKPGAGNPAWLFADEIIIE
ncbi:MAG: family 20 glycosylhydrolase, partial [Bacteroidota bacterium]